MKLFSPAEVRLRCGQTADVPRSHEEEVECLLLYYWDAWEECQRLRAVIEALEAELSDRNIGPDLTQIDESA